MPTDNSGSREETRQREIAKSLQHKVIELTRSLQLLNDAIGSVRSGKPYHLAVLSGQLRALLFDKAGRSEARLIQVAKQFNFPLTVFHMKGVDDQDFPIPDKLVFHAAGFPLTTHRTQRNQVQSDFENTLQLKVVRFNGTDYSMKTIIEWFANKAGGAHFSKQLPEDFVAMLSVNVGEMRPLERIVLQLAEATLSAGINLLNSVTEVETHLGISVAKIPTSDVCLLDAKHPTVPMRFSLFLMRGGGLMVRLIGIDGVQLAVSNQKYIVWQSLHNLSVTVKILDDLLTSVTMHFDGEEIGSQKFNVPLFLQSDWLDFDCYVNRLQDQSPQDFSFALAEMFSLGQHMTPEEKARMLVRFFDRLANKDLKVMVLEPFAFGRCEPGTKSMTITGTASHREARSIWPTDA